MATQEQRVGDRISPSSQHLQHLHSSQKVKRRYSSRGNIDRRAHTSPAHTYCFSPRTICAASGSTASTACPSSSFEKVVVLTGEPLLSRGQDTPSWGFLLPPSFVAIVGADAVKAGDASKSAWSGWSLGDRASDTQELHERTYRRPSVSSLLILILS